MGGGGRGQDLLVWVLGALMPGINAEQHLVDFNLHIDLVVALMH